MREGISPDTEQKGRARKARAARRDVELKKQTGRTPGEDRRGERGRRGWNRAVREAGAEGWYLNLEEVRAGKPGAVRGGRGWRVLGKAGDRQVGSVTRPARRAHDSGE